MSVPPQLIQALMASRDGAGAAGGAPMAGPPGQGGGAPPPMQPPPGAPAGAQPGQRPQASPLSTPKSKTGLQTAALTNVHIAVNMLEEALPAFGSESAEGADILKALGVLRKHLSKKDNSDLVPAEVMQMVAKLPQMGGGNDIQRRIMQQLKSAPISGQPLPGAPPGGAPPGMPPGAGGGMPQLPGM